MHDEAMNINMDMEASSSPTNADTMKVLGAMAYGPAKKVLSFTQIPKPNPTYLSPTEVLIRVHYAELNPVDQHKLNAGNAGESVMHPPLVVGYGGSGVVENVGPDADEHSKDLLDQNVVFLANPHPTKTGSYADYIVCDRRLVAIIPNEINMRAAATVPLAGCTAYESLVKVGLGLDSGSSGLGLTPTPTHTPTHTLADTKTKRLLVVGGAGGVGSWIIQLARACHPNDLEIIATVSTDSQWCLDMGAHRTIHHNDIMTLGSGPKGSVDSIICLTEPTKEIFNALAEVIRPFGNICLVVAGKGIENLNLGFVFFKCANVSTQTVFSSMRHGYHLAQNDEMQVILDFMKDGKIDAPLHPMLMSGSHAWEEAMKDGGLMDVLTSGHCRGKLVMKIGKGED